MDGLSIFGFMAFIFVFIVWSIVNKLEKILKDSGMMDKDSKSD
jgi:hypothetical protein